MALADVDRACGRRARLSRLAEPPSVSSPGTCIAGRADEGQNLTNLSGELPGIDGLPRSWDAG